MQHPSFSISKLVALSVAGLLACAVAAPGAQAKGSHGKPTAVPTPAVKAAKQQASAKRSEAGATHSKSQVIQAAPAGATLKAAEVTESAAPTASPSPAAHQKDRCEHTLAKIDKRSGKLADRFDSAQTKVNAHVTAAENFYQETVVPAGGSVENYDELVASIEANASVVSTALNAARATVLDFDCNGDLKAQLTTFRSNMQAVNHAMAAYRESVSALLESIEQAYQSTQATPEPTDEPTVEPTPEPTATPSESPSPEVTI